MRAFAMAIFLAEVFNPACNAMPARQAELSELCSFLSHPSFFCPPPLPPLSGTPRRLPPFSVAFASLGFSFGVTALSTPSTLATYKIFRSIVFAYLLHNSLHDRRFVCTLWPTKRSQTVIFYYIYVHVYARAYIEIVNLVLDGYQPQFDYQICRINLERRVLHRKTATCTVFDVGIVSY